MLKRKNSKHTMILRKNVIILVFVLTSFLFQVIFRMIFASNSYSFFVELSHASGIQVGASVRMRGMHVGSIKSIQLKSNCVLAVVNIDSHKTLIPALSIIETAQTGLLSDSVIDIVPYDGLSSQCHESQNPLSKYCNTSLILCNRMYLVADRGLNYDDLVRSATRISQRFDDPRFFHVFYVFLRSSIEIMDFIVGLSTVIKSNSPYVVFDPFPRDFF